LPLTCPLWFRHLPWSGRLPPRWRASYLCRPPPVARLRALAPEPI